MGHISELPSKVLVKILSLLPNFDKRRAQQVCNRWRIVISKRFSLLRQLMWPMDQLDQHAITQDDRRLLPKSHRISIAYPNYYILKHCENTTKSTNRKHVASRSHDTRKLYLADTYNYEANAHHQRPMPFDTNSIENCQQSVINRELSDVSNRFSYCNNNDNGYTLSSSLSEYSSSADLPPTPPRSKRNRQNCLPPDPVNYQQDNFLQRLQRLIDNNNKDIVPQDHHHVPPKLNEETENNIATPFSLPRTYNYSKKLSAVQNYCRKTTTAPSTNTPSFVRHEPSDRSIISRRVEESVQEFLTDESRLERDEVVQSLYKIDQKKPIEDTLRLSPSVNLPHSTNNCANLRLNNIQAKSKEESSNTRNSRDGQQQRQFYESNPRLRPKERHQSFYLLSQNDDDDQGYPYQHHHDNVDRNEKSNTNNRESYSYANSDSNTYLSQQIIMSPVRSASSSSSRGHFNRPGSSDLYDFESQRQASRYQQPLSLTKTTYYQKRLADSAVTNNHDYNRITIGHGVENSRSIRQYKKHQKNPVTTNRKGIVAHHLHYHPLPPGFNQSDIDNFLKHDDIAVPETHYHKNNNNKTRSVRVHQIQANKEELSKARHDKKIVVNKRKRTKQ